MSLETQSLDSLYKNADGKFNEFLPVDESTVEAYYENLDKAEELPPGPGQHKGARQESKPRRRKSRNAHQLLLNKLAQVRYRERKRQRQADLEDRVNNLEDKVSELKTLQQQSDALEAQNSQLQKEVLEIEAELLRTKQAAAANGRAAKGGSESQKTAAEKKAELNVLVQKWLDTVEEIRQLYKMLMMDARGANSGAVLKNCADFSWLPPGQQRMMLNIIARIEMLAETVANLCVRVLRLDGLSIEAIMSANFDRCKSLAGWKDELKWVRAAQELNLSDQQVAGILQARSISLRKLQSIYVERQQLNGEAVRGLIHSGSAAEADSAEQQHLFDVLSRLEDNLRAEQRAVAEQEHVTFKTLLTPIQSGLFILKAFPDHCDCLALWHAVHQLYSQQQ